MRLPVRQSHAITLLAAISITTILISVTVLIWGLRDRELEHAKVETVSITQMLMEHTQQNIEGADLILQGVQERLSSEYGRQFELDSAPTHLLLAARLSGMGQLSALFVVDAAGKVANSSRGFPTPDLSVADRNYYRHFSETSSRAMFIDKPVRRRIDNTWTLHMSRPLFYPSGKFRGVVVAALSLPQFEALYKLVKLDYDRPIALYLEDGTLVASLPHREDVVGTRAPELAMVKTPKENEVVTVRHEHPNEATHVFTLGRLAKYPLMIGVTDDEALSLMSWKETVVPIGVAAAIICLFMATAALYLNGKINYKEKELRVANDRYEQTVESVMDAIVAIDASFHILLFNPAAEKMFGLTMVEALGAPMEVLIPERLRERHIAHLHRFVKEDVGSRTMAPHLSIFGRRADGSEFPIESTISKSTVDGKIQMTAVLRDVTEQRRAEAELRESNNQLRKLSASLQTVREEERTRISRELHDDLGQQLTGLKLSLSWLTNRIKGGRETTSENLDEIRHSLDTAISSVRRISTELRPPILDDLAFKEAIAWQCTEFAKRSGLQINLNLAAAENIQDEARSTALFRVVQESLTNVIRHANATQVHIDFVARGDHLALTVSDNGQGFQNYATQNGIGLVSMRERSIAIGAEFTITCSPGLGTTVTLKMPLHAPQQSEELA